MGYKILVADDEEVLRALVRRSLDDLASEIHEAANGLDAIKKAWEIHPDLIIMDIRMPGKTGYDACEVLKENPNSRNIPILFLTACSGDMDRQVGMSLGADRYLTKPFNIDTLRQEVIAMLERGRKDPTPSMDEKQP